MQLQKSGLISFHDIWARNAAGMFLQPRSQARGPLPLPVYYNYSCMATR